MILQFLAAAGLIVIAGTALAKAADDIADETGLGKIFVGGLLLAGATSLPELMVDIKAIKMGLPDLAVGDLLGSSLLNLLILAILDFTFPSVFRRTSFSPAYAHHALSATLGLLLTAIVGIGIMAKLPHQLLGIGIFPWAVVIFYFFGMRLVYMEGKSSARIAADLGTTSEKKPLEVRRLISPVFRYVLTTGAIVLAAPYLVEAADQIAVRSGLGHTFVGTTLVAVTTSLPELAATVAAFRGGSPDLALGNIFGSNAFNMLLIVPLDAMFEGSLFANLASTHALTAFSVIAAISIAVIGQIYRKKDRDYFSEPSSELIIVVVLGLLFLLSQV
jgi:cation:H+ antiporter